MTTRDELFQTGDQERIWKKYCGFFDLSMAEFMDVQKHLLMDQIDTIWGSPITKRFMPEKPENASDFRRLVPLTTYEDYAPSLTAKDESVLPAKPFLWARTSGRGGSPKWIPYTDRAIDNFNLYGIAALILACAEEKGQVNIGSGFRLLQNLPPPPYLSGILLSITPQIIDARIIPPLDKYQNVDFQIRTQAGFNIALRTGVDCLASLTTVLVKLGERFTENSGRLRVQKEFLHPKVMIRLLSALLRSKRENRKILPRDLWPIKGLISYGTDTSIYREQLVNYWGKEPLEVYACTEAGILAISSWTKRHMTFVPHSCFLEFIPEKDWQKSLADRSHRPSTVLLDEVIPGESYEVVISSFHGLPLLRYRMGDVVKITSPADEEANIRLPQLVFATRADDVINFAGFTRLDEKTVWQAIASTGIKYADWSIRKELENGEPVIRLYIELKEDRDAKEIEEAVHQKLVGFDSDYRDVEKMLEMRPLRVKLLPAGSFQRYYERKKQSGADMAHLKPPHMNASDAAIRDLVG